ncbi:MAG: hypothetical protein RLZZ245_2902 [Verrucomicrobiota bacterium]
MALIFWGIMTGRPILGVILALVVEAAHWTKFRWDFAEEATSRTWQFNVVIIFIAATLIYMDGDPFVALPILLTWLPPLLLPMQFIQSYGMAKSLPLNTFSFLAKQRRRRNLRLGLTETAIRINFGNAYFVTTLVAATLGNRASSNLFLPGIIVLSGWMLLSSSRSRPLALVVALSVAGMIAVAGQQGLEALEDWFGNRGATQSQFDPNSSSTMIGRPGSVVQSPAILWRIRPENTMPPPRLLRVGGYNSYRVGTWVNQTLKSMQFNDLDTRLAEGTPYYILAPAATESEQLAAVSRSLPEFQIRGAATAETPLPLPGDAASLRDFELDGIERNSFGTVRVFPKQSVIEGTVVWKKFLNSEGPPLKNSDIKVPHQEREALAKVVRELKLDDIPTLDQKLAAIRTWFAKNFRYSRYLSIRSSTYVSTHPTALTQFLTKSRSGHCEYFASATTLLLRQAGIPARYTTGYAAIERDVKRGEYIIRGTHGHAWTRVWDSKKRRWFDFDTTPPSWETTPTETTAKQRFIDLVQRLREDFFLWRNRPANRLAASSAMIFIALAVAAFIAKRLWKSKRRLTANDSKHPFYKGPALRTPLHDLENHAQSRLGPRPPGMPFARWIANLRPSLTHPATLDEAISIHQRLRFDPAPSDPAAVSQLSEISKKLASELKRH